MSKKNIGKFFVNKTKDILLKKKLNNFYNTNIEKFNKSMLENILNPQTKEYLIIKKQMDNENIKNFKLKNKHLDP